MKSQHTQVLQIPLCTRPVWIVERDSPRAFLSNKYEYEHVDRVCHKRIAAAGGESYAVLFSPAPPSPELTAGELLI